LKKIVVFLLVIFCAFVAVAQDAPKAEVFGGYQFFSLDTKNFGGLDRQTFQGWDADVAANLNKNFGIVGDISGAYKSESASSGGVSAEAKLRLYNFLFGPRFSYRTEKVTPFAEVLFGAGHLSASGSATGLGSVSGSLNGFAMAFGGGIDINAGKHVAIRPAKFDYVMNRFSDSGVSETLHNFRYAGGIVFKF
jgi:hypothetical protein